MTKTEADKQRFQNCEPRTILEFYREFHEPYDCNYSDKARLWYALKRAVETLDEFEKRELGFDKDLEK